MTEEDVNKSKALLEAILWAKECGLTSEFITFFLDEFKRCGNVYDAIWYANCEWDL